MFTVGELAKRFNAKLIGDANCKVEHLGPLDKAKPGDICFLRNIKYSKFLKNTAASAVILTEDAIPEEITTNLLVVSDPYVTYARIANLFYPQINDKHGVAESAVVSESADIDSTAWIGENTVIGDGVSIGSDSIIGPGCAIEKNVTIGENCKLVANVTICHHVNIGNRVIIQPGAVLGGDGFGFAFDEGKWVKIPQIGTVTIGDDVEIGANTTIDRGALEDTIIDNGVKLDNQIQVAHNVCIGEHTVIAGCTGIAGSAKIGKYCQIGGLVGIVGHLEIADNVILTGKAHVTHSIHKAGVYASGVPLQPIEKWRRNYARYKQLDDIMKRLKMIENQVGEK